MSFLVRTHVPLAPLTTLQTGGAAAYYVEIETLTDLEKAVAFAEEKQLPFYVFGGGSNLLVSDKGYWGLVLHQKLKGITYEDLAEGTVAATVMAGENFDALVEATTREALWGLENLSHIPGTVGATPVQNVGAYGVEVADVISHVTVFDTITKKITTLKNAECHFSYRHSIFKEKSNFIIVSVTFVLQTKPNPKITYADLRDTVVANPTPEDIRRTIISIRAAKFPDWNVVGTAGSFFKNPLLPDADIKLLLSKYPEIPTYTSTNGMTKISLGYVLDKICGLKGFAHGRVRLYEKQALVLVAEYGATTSDIKNFVKIISDTVFTKTGIKISQEVTEI